MLTVFFLSIGTNNNSNTRYTTQIKRNKLVTALVAKDLLNVAVVRIFGPNPVWVLLLQKLPYLLLTASVVKNLKSERAAHLRNEWHRFLCRVKSINWFDQVGCWTTILFQSFLDGAIHVIYCEA